jgi:ribosomal protein S18 acetylase RimI-like enzyme
MKLRMRAFAGEVDLREMAALVHAFPTINMHVVDLPYRFSSWALDYPENIGLWIDGNGALLGWAVMQTPFWTIDYAYHPQETTSLHQQILAWADERAQQVVDTLSGRPMWFINVFTSQQDRIHDLEESGFASQADVGENSWTKVLMRRAGQIPIKASVLPDGFTIRPLGGEREVAAYVELHRATFQSKSMTIAWRQRTLERPEYIANLDLVAIAPDGRLAAFCICWLNRKSSGEISGQIEPLGVHEDFRKQGLGRCILAEGLRRLQQHGAGWVCVETDNYRDEAFALYESMGFHVAQDVLVYRKDYGNL